MVIKDFTNNNFIVLSYLYDAKDKNNVVKITQDEIAEHLNLSRVTVNKAIILFIQHGYVRRDLKHVGRYIVTDFGSKIVETIRTLSVEANTISIKETLDCANIF